MLTVKMIVKAARMDRLHLMAVLLVFRFQQVRQQVHAMGHHHLSLRLSQVTRHLFVRNDHGDHSRNNRSNRNRQGTQAAHKAAQERGQRLLAPVVTPAKSAA
jgi:hypothetical protein